ncbi:phosphogluconate dehydratase [Poseidonibacter antarcticus]|uniref:phosphogluconate dehydratase n=1 Tax=Poseidonibacter antarcticus TaxID=2478538 RepID=UPI000EF49DB2|nr:phosphogluconate dehydratase [Poseidonibacter antarcticus]
MNNIILKVKENITKRSQKSRAIYLDRINNAKIKNQNKKSLSCSNLAHVMAPMSDDEKKLLKEYDSYNMGIITAYNDMLSAHEPYHKYPSILKNELLKYSSTAQVASGVPAMCDGVTQGEIGMELSLFSRDTIAMASAVGLSHNVYDGAFFLGVCDKIVPGLVISALSFGHLPAIFVPAGPMKSGISNKEKAKFRQEYAKGNIKEKELLEVESSSYHSCGTCTFFGTANSNQMLLEMMGLQLPNASFVNTNTPLREELTKYSAKALHELKTKNISLSDIIDERSFINAIVGLMASGGSTNHTIHLIAMAKACGIVLTWEDFDEISKVTPLLCKMYPNGSADVNTFRDAGGMGVVISELIEKGLVFEDVNTVVGKGLKNFVVEPILKEGKLTFKKIDGLSKNLDVISSGNEPFNKQGGLKLLQGNLGQSVIKTSALLEKHLYVKQKAIVFTSQEQLQEEFKKGNLTKDFIAVVKYQGPKANGMPELHKLLPPLGVLQDLGYKVALITDGRMSGASGKIPSAIHLSPEAKDEGLISKIKDGDLIELDAINGKLNLLIEEDELESRIIENKDLSSNNFGVGRELFNVVRKNVSSASTGASIFALPGEEDL